MSRRLRPTRRAARARHYRRRGGPWDVPSLDTVLTEAGPRPDLLVDGDVRLDSAQVNEVVAGLAGGLRERGVNRGDVVAWQLPNRHEAVLLYRACWRLGAVAAPVHHRAGPADVEAVLAQVHPVLVVAATGLPLAGQPGAVVISERDGAEGRGSARSGPLTPHPDQGAGTASWEELVDGRPVLESPARASDVACVLFTAGSTGSPKGVLHTHRSLASKALSMPAVHGLATDDTVLMPAPLAHVSGLLNGVLVPGVVPMKTVLMERWTPQEALALAARERVSFMVGPPTFFVQMVDAPGFSPEQVSTLRLVSSGGAGVSPAFVEEASAALGAVVKRTYGSTEAPTVATSHADDDPARAARRDGRAVGEAELRVVDPATGEPRGGGEVGELWVRGPEVCAGYVEPARTREAFARGGWFRTGDLAVLDAEGWLEVVGRLKDVIIRGGENVSASEVEAVLEEHPAVRQAVALGEADGTMGERVVAFVVADGEFDLAACRAWFEERGVARFKTPERVVQVPDLPLLPAGKPDRAALREQLASP